MKIIGADIISQHSHLDTFTPSYFLYDGHGSTRGLTDVTGKLTNTFHFDGYGMDLGWNRSDSVEYNQVNKPATDMLYSGEQYDTPLQMQSLRARYYDQNVGGFNRLDDFAGNMHDPQSLHKYAYCHGDGINGIDPSGESKLLDLLIVVGVVLLISSYHIASLNSANKRVKRQEKVITGMTSPLGPNISEVFRDLRRYNIPIPVPIVIDDPNITWDDIEEHLFYHLGVGILELNDAFRDNVFVIRDVSQKEPPEPTFTRLLGDDHNGVLWIHTTQTGYVYKGSHYLRDGTLDKARPKQRYPWKAALAHELMHAYRRTSETVTNDNAIEEFLVAYPVGLSYAKALGY